MKRSLALVGCGFVLASCGGGGGNSTPVVPATTYRANQVGDSWAYSLYINLGKQGSGPGTLSHGLVSDTYNGQSTIRENQLFQFKLPAGETTSSGYSEYSLQGALLATSVNGTLYAVTSDTFNTGNTIDATTNATGVITLSTGETLTESYKVIGAEMCTTPNGTYKTWVVKQTVVDSSGITDNFTIWVAPETGSYVKITDVTTTPIGTAYSYSASLTAITAPASVRGIRPLRLALPLLRLR